MSVKNLLFLVAVILIFGCKQKESFVDPYVDSITHPLHDISSSVSLPPFFKSSQRNKIKDEVPSFKKGHIAYDLMLEVFDNSDFSNISPNIFIDTTAELHALVIIDTDLILITKENSENIKDQIDKNFAAIFSNFGNLSANEVQSYRNFNGSANLYKCKYALKDHSSSKPEFYWTSFIYSTDIRSYYIYEVNAAKEDQYNAIWSIRL